MAKWDVNFTEADARKVAEKLFPHDVHPIIGMPPMECPPDCKACAEWRDAWEAQVKEVWEALNVLKS